MPELESSICNELECTSLVVLSSNLILYLLSPTELATLSNTLSRIYLKLDLWGLGIKFPTFANTLDPTIIIFCIPLLFFNIYLSGLGLLIVILVCALCVSNCISNLVSAIA